MVTKKDIVQKEKYVYEISQSYKPEMRVPARFFSTESMLEDILHDSSLEQLANTASLPGIQQYAYAMPDIHQGYGFPIGGVVATAIHEGGVISPGGIGYDINCGVRLLASTITAQDAKRYIGKIADALFEAVPSGVGRGSDLIFSVKHIDTFLQKGAAAMVEKGYGTESDFLFCQEQGHMAEADSSAISDAAKKRGADQLGTLGSGNHFLEVQYVDEVFDTEIAQAYGLWQGQVTVMIHCGSRGLGHQTCTDYLRLFMKDFDPQMLKIPDKELICAPFLSPQGQQYFSAMAAASNYAWANRHLIGHWTRKAWNRVFGNAVQLRTVYDLSHNIGKVETHEIDGILKKCLVHRKGATQAFGPGTEGLPDLYKLFGQPVLIPGTMGTASYVMAGTSKSMQIAFGSCCHGAGRRLSRVKAKQMVRGKDLRNALKERGILIRSDSDPGLAEEAPIAYKDVEEVVEVTDAVGLAKKVARLRPLAVIKGG